MGKKRKQEFVYTAQSRMVLRSRGYDGSQLAWCLSEADSQQNNLIVPNQAYEYFFIFGHFYNNYNNYIK